MAKAKVLKFDAAGRGLSKSEILKVCEAENVRFMRLQFTDIFGVIKNVELPSSQFSKALDGEIQFDGSSIEGFTRIEESDMNLVPDLDSFAIYPWAHRNGEKVGRLICDVYNPDGSPFAGCPRMTLKKQMDKASALGYTMVTGPEAEFFLFRRDANGDPIVDTHDEGAYFDLTPVDRGEEARRDIVLALEQMGFEVEAAHHEVAAGQHEIDFKYADAVTTADRVSTFRFIVKKVAMDHGLHATFMPKPIYGINGSGMHVHQSFLDKKGNNVFYDAKAKYQLSKTAMHYTGGILRHARGVRRDHEPARQLLQAPGARLRGPDQRGLVDAQPLAARPRARAARHGHPHRGPHAGSLLQPVPRLRRDARLGPRRREEPDGSGRAGRPQHLQDERAREAAPADRPAAGESVRGLRQPGEGRRS